VDQLPESGWWLAIGILGLLALVPIVWAVVDVVRRPPWQYPTSRKVLWVATLVVGWVVLWPLALTVALVHLLVVRKRLPPPGPAPAGPQIPIPPQPPIPAPPSPPAGWYPDPSGFSKERWWDGKGWSPHVR
jgi:hypothetical protein